MRIYIGGTETPLLGVTRRNDIPIHLEKNRWQFVDNIADADIIPLCTPPLMSLDEQTLYSLEDQLNLIGPYINDKWFIILMHTHISETTGQKTIKMFLDKYPIKKLLITTANSETIPNHIYCNHNFNFVKAHFTEYNKFDLQFQRVWVSHCTKASFVLNPIKEHITTNKKFLIPNIIRSESKPDGREFKNYARIELSKYIDPEESYYSDTRTDVWLLPEEKELFNMYDRVNGSVGTIPIASEYYNDSIVSAYVETIGRSDGDAGPVRAITEKTYIPLLKGHFILPFSYPGIIQDLKDQGFLFPDWIDYSYDLIDNNEQRLRAFLKSFKNLKHKYPIHVLRDVANRDIEIRKHNRRVIVKGSYDSLYDRIKKATGL